MFYRDISIQLYSIWKLNNFRIIIWMVSLHYFQSNIEVHTNVLASQRCMEHLVVKQAPKQIIAIEVFHFVKSRRGERRGKGKREKKREEKRGEGREGRGEGRRERRENRTTSRTSRGW